MRIEFVHIDEPNLETKRAEKNEAFGDSPTPPSAVTLGPCSISAQIPVS